MAVAVVGQLVSATSKRRRSVRTGAGHALILIGLSNNRFLLGRFGRKLRRGRRIHTPTIFRGDHQADSIRQSVLLN